MNTRWTDLVKLHSSPHSSSRCLLALTRKLHSAHPRRSLVGSLNQRLENLHLTSVSCPSAGLSSLFAYFRFRFQQRSGDREDQNRGRLALWGVFQAPAGCSPVCLCDFNISLETVAGCSAFASHLSCRSHWQYRCCLASSTCCPRRLASGSTGSAAPLAGVG